jgi:Ca-activated chloride channel family protein
MRGSPATSHGPNCKEPDTAVALIAGEVEGLLTQTAQAASRHVRLSPVVRAVLVVNDLPANRVDDGVMVELGGFYADETRKRRTSAPVTAGVASAA